MHKPDGVTRDTKQHLIEEFDKAIRLIHDMSVYSFTRMAVPWDTIHRWENLIEYAKKEEAVD